MSCVRTQLAHHCPMPSQSTLFFFCDKTFDIWPDLLSARFCCHNAAVQRDGARKRTEVVWLNPATTAALHAQQPEMFSSP